MTIAPCPVCGAARVEAGRGTVLDDIAVQYLKCDACGFLGTQAPHWLDRAYSDAIPPVDTGVVARNLLVADLCTALFGGPTPPSIVDVGGGYGMLVRRLRDIGFDARWADPHCQNLLARGFEFTPGGPADVAVAVEVIEHVPDPRAWVAQQLDDTGASTLLFTTEVLPAPVPDPSWWYFTPETGQHVSFFERRTIHRLGAALGLEVRSRANVHVVSRHPVPAARFLAAVSRLRPLAARWRARSMRSRTDTDSPILTPGS